MNEEQAAMDSTSAPQPEADSTSAQQEMAAATTGTTGVMIQSADGKTYYFISQSQVASAVAPDQQLAATVWGNSTSTVAAKSVTVNAYWGVVPMPATD